MRGVVSCTRSKTGGCLWIVERTSDATCDEVDQIDIIIFLLFMGGWLVESIICDAASRDAVAVMEQDN